MARSNQYRLHVLIACGGTGGHLYPGIAVAEVLRARRHKVTLLISEKKIDALAASAHEDLRFEKLPSLAMPKPFSLKMVRFLWSMWKSLRQCRQLIKNENIKVVLGMGGFTSFAPILAARAEGAHACVHDSNAIPGKANRVTARYCNKVLLGFEEASTYFPNKETVVTGTPVRAALAEAASMQSDDPYTFFNLNPKRKTILIIGGSQGARGLNNIVAQSLDLLDQAGVQLLHITGPNDYQEVCDSYQGHEMKLRSHVAAFCHRMELAYQIADLALARSGASTLAELAYFGVPSILVPYPFAADDHQTKNAEIFSNREAALLITEAELSPIRFADEILRITKDAELHQHMADRARGLAPVEAAENIADAIEAMASEEIS